MASFVVAGPSRIRGQLTLPGDKSIAHRAVILSALAQGKTSIQNFPLNADTLATIQAFKKLGIKIKLHKKFYGTAKVEIFGQGLFGLRAPKGVLFLGDSGTTFRILLGVLAGQNFKARLTAARSLSRRPMLRVNAPLRKMGAKIRARRLGGSEEYPPINIKGGELKGITYKMPVASAQVKSALLLAGLYAQGKTTVIEPIKTRDHTERMLKLFKAGVKSQSGKVIIRGGRELFSPQVIYIPGDISSASFFMVAAAVLPDSQLCIEKVNLNPSRMGIIRVLKRMGADINIKYQISDIKYSEPIGDITVKSSRLKAVAIKKSEIPALIDELPVLMVAAACARGQSRFEGAGELRFKEADRIKSMYQNLRKMGVDIEVKKAKKGESILIKGGGGLQPAKVKSFGDHRTAMSMVVAGLKGTGKTFIDEVGCINKSFPGFLATLKSLIPPSQRLSF